MEMGAQKVGTRAGVIQGDGAEVTGGEEAPQLSEGGSHSMAIRRSGRPCGGLVYLRGSPGPSHLLRLYDVSQVAIREDPAVERGTVRRHPGPSPLLSAPLLTAPTTTECPPTHCSPWQVESAAKDCGLPRSFPW